MKWVKWNFVRLPFFCGWTIGYDLKNGCLLQFTKTIPRRGGHYILNLLVFSWRRARIWDKDRIWVGFGWSQSWGRIWLKPKA
jgi:hypothetical protein